MAADMIPPAAARSFLDANGWAGAAILPLAGDASFRRYFRVKNADATAILMDAPPPHEDPRPFIGMARWLVEHGFAAPAVIAVDLDHGLVLLQDFGDDRMREAIEADPALGPKLYGIAVDTLVALHRVTPAPLRPYDRAELHREADLLVDWYCPAVGIDADRDAYRAAWDGVFDLALTARPVTVLRDYHAENLMLAPQSRLGLLDFQDALAGHPAYDLVSLLQDARRDVEPAIERAMLAKYRAETGAGDDFDAAYHVLGAQRNAKIIGIFTRLWKRDGKSRYPALCPRVWRYLERDLAHPALASVAAWFAGAVPSTRRGDPMVIGAR